MEHLTSVVSNHLSAKGLCWLRLLLFKFVQFVSPLLACRFRLVCILIPPPDREPSPARSSHDDKRAFKSISRSLCSRTRCEPWTACGPVSLAGVGCYDDDGKMRSESFRAGANGFFFAPNVALLAGLAIHGSSYGQLHAGGCSLMSVHDYAVNFH